ncbi:MAG: polysaccharide biosynthesis protein [Elusimicrobia bacterium]|nr:MAG: polysaccharide biosynthesis protein [Elusimicrobiota bacterium]
MVRRNIVANFLGSAWQTLVSLIFIPFYIRILGIEAWGLIGFFFTLQGVLSLLDLGLSATLTRETARLSALKGREDEMRDLVRTLEIVYWGVAIFVAFGVLILSQYISHNWVRPGQLSLLSIEQSCVMMGFIIALQMPAGFYSGGLMGLQEQVLVNIINGVMAILRSGGALLVLWLVSPTIQAYFVWQVVVGIFSVSFLGYFLWRRLPKTLNRATFRMKILSGVWRFTAGMSGVSILTVILTQIDKVILSKMLSLEAFGYYTLATMVSMSLAKLFTPVFYSIYPKFTQLVAISDMPELIRIYHKSCQFISVLILPVAAILVLFSYEVMLFWTHSNATAAQTYLLVSILVCGSALNGLMNPPYALQLAFGWTRLSVIKNIVAVVLVVPGIILMADRYGATGAAFAWLLLNLGYLVFEIPVMHFKLLRTEKWHWYIVDVGGPFFVSLVVAGLGRLLLNQTGTTVFVGFYLAAIFLLTAIGVVMAAPSIRGEAYKYLSRVKLIYG